MLELKKPAEVDEAAKPEQDAGHLARMLDFERIGKLAVEEAREENRRLGIPNYHEENGRIVSDQDLPTGEARQIGQASRSSVS
jgi:hypothetical protein